MSKVSERNFARLYFLFSQCQLSMAHSTDIYGSCFLTSYHTVDVKG